MTAFADFFCLFFRSYFCFSPSNFFWFSSNSFSLSSSFFYFSSSLFSFHLSRAEKIDNTRPDKWDGKNKNHKPEIWLHELLFAGNSFSVFWVWVLRAARAKAGFAPKKVFQVIITEP